MRYKRINTVAVDFSAIPKIPTPAIIKEFLERRLGLDVTNLRSVEINNINNNNNRKVVYVGLPETLSAATFAEKNNLKAGIRLKPTNTTYLIPVVFVEDDIVDVRVRFVPPETPNEVIAESLRKYGEVLAVTNEIWRDHFPGAASGVRVVGMKITRNIPSFITIGNYKAHIGYSGQTETCKHCDRESHHGQSCKTAKKKSAKNSTDGNGSSTQQQKNDDNESPTQKQKSDKNDQTKPKPTTTTEKSDETEAAAPMDEDGFQTVKRKREKTANRPWPGPSSRQTTDDGDESESSSEEVDEKKLRTMKEDEAFKLGLDNFRRWQEINRPNNRDTRLRKT